MRLTILFSHQLRVTGCCVDEILIPCDRRGGLQLAPLIQQRIAIHVEEIDRILNRLLSRNERIRIAEYDVQFALRIQPHAVNILHVSLLHRTGVKGKQAASFQRFATNQTNG